MPKKEKDYISAKLDEMHKDVKEVKEQLIPAIQREIAILKIKNGVWSGLAGVIGGALALIGLNIAK